MALFYGCPAAFQPLFTLDADVAGGATGVGGKGQGAVVYFQMVDVYGDQVCERFGPIVHARIAGLFL